MFFGLGYEALVVLGVLVLLFPGRCVALARSLGETMGIVGRIGRDK